ncbi:MAG: EAL domain-containing protein [Proteobacteria bacterium]|nr:EAL domain-containing protein [Pseudomonadota bacterium]
MSIILHCGFALIYGLIAGAAAFVLPDLVAAYGLYPSLAVLAGPAAGAALLHSVLTRLVHDRRTVAALAALKAVDVELRGELKRGRDETKRVLETIKNSLEERQGQIDNINEVMTEVRVLQGLVEQLSNRNQAEQKQEVAATAAAAAGGAARQRQLYPPHVVTDLDEGKLLDIVREGLRSNRVDLYVQPIVSLPQRKRRHYECFSRIRTEDDLLVVPEQYLAVAERERLIAAIDNMLLFRCVQLVRRTQRPNYNASLFVNISEHTLADTNFFRDFVAFMAGNRELASRIVFEFNQGNVSRHGEAVRLELERLARQGFRFSMDKIGDLNLDLGDLSRRHFSFIKLDATRLLEEINRPTQALDMPAFKQALDQAGIDLIVEKIESEHTLVELLDFPIDFGQGFLFGEPRPSREA